MSRRRIHPLPTYEQVSAALSYDRDTGIISRKSSDGATPVPPTMTNYGYHFVSVCGSMLLGHRLAWLLDTGEWPVGELDHRNGIRNDNRIANLRLATRSENSRNKTVYNSTGYRGVTKRKGSYIAYARIEGKQTYLGSFKTPQEAHECYVREATVQFGEFVNTTVIVRGTIAATIVFNAGDAS